MGDKLLSIYETLLAHYGEPNWWPAETPYEVIVGAVLTQNTAWGSVEKAIAGFGGKLSPETVAAMPTDELVEVIRPAVFFNQKASYLKAVTAWYAGYGYDVPTVKKQPLGKLRSELLSTKGVGQETADSILLYAFGFPTFVVDAYTNRLCGRYPIEADFLRQAFTDVNPAYQMNKQHWNMVTLGGDVPEYELKRMVGNSYDLTRPKVRKRK